MAGLLTKHNEVQQFVWGQADTIIVYNDFSKLSP